MIDSIITYMSTWPMWLQLFAIIILILSPFGVVIAVIYKIILAKKIKAGSVEIDMTDEPDEKKDVSAN